MKYYLPLLAVLLLTACHHKELPEAVLPEDRMADFLTEAYQLEGFYAVETHYRYDSLPEAVMQRYDSLLNAQDITRDQVEHSFDYYTQHLDVYERIHDTVVARLEVLREAAGTLPVAPVPTSTSVLPADTVVRSIPRPVLGK